MEKLRKKIKIFILVFLVVLVAATNYLWKQNREFEQALIAANEKIQVLEKSQAEKNIQVADLEGQNKKCIAKLKIFMPWSEEILPPPKFIEKLPQKMRTNYMGEVQLAWYSVTGAKKTLVTITDQKGQIIKQSYTPYATLYIKNLPTPQGVPSITYYVRLQSLNANDEPGPEGERRELTVFPYARIMAPVIEKIVVED